MFLPGRPKCLDYGEMMKVFLRRNLKSILFGLLLTITAIPNLAIALSQSRTVPYYGEQFYKEINYKYKDNELKNALRKIISSYHMENQGGFDDVVDRCGGKNCYTHVSLGYDRARIFMMGVFYLVDHGNGNYALPDKYCDNLKTSQDFRGGNGPAPNQIPDGNVLNTEHTWPQSRFTGRYDRSMQKSDLHHLFPTDNQMNSIRGNNPFGEVARVAKPLRCPSKYGRAMNGNADVFEPPDNHKGNVARALFYFSTRYELPIDRYQEETLRRWHQQDPVDDEELARNEAIQKVQGNRNPFIDHPELAENIRDF